MKCNKVVGHEGMTVRMAGLFQLFPRDQRRKILAEMRGHMASPNADGYWMMDNHPF
ncbi:MAG: hypothetical protein H0V35_00570 [Nitrospira sp.]|nr:hypothetical protein [Nitrospira sp.]